MRRKNSRCGTTLIEFAGSLILLTTTFAGIFQLGYTFFNYNALVNAVRGGARYASLQPPAAASANPDFSKAVRNLVVYGEPAPAPDAKPVVTGLTADRIEVTLGSTATTVSVRGFEIDALFSKIKLDGRPTVTFPITNGVAK